MLIALIMYIYILWCSIWYFRRNELPQHDLLWQFYLRNAVLRFFYFPSVIVHVDQTYHVDLVTYLEVEPKKLLVKKVIIGN